jgi:hypothetical protein
LRPKFVCVCLLWRASVQGLNHAPPLVITERIVRRFLGFGTGQIPDKVLAFCLAVEASKRAHSLLPYSSAFNEGWPSSAAIVEAFGFSFSAYSRGSRIPNLIQPSLQVRGRTYKPKHGSCNSAMFLFVTLFRAFLWHIHDYAGQKAPDYRVK